LPNAEWDMKIGVPVAKRRESRELPAVSDVLGLKLYSRYLIKILVLFSIWCCVLLLRECRVRECVF